MYMESYTHNHNYYVYPLDPSSSQLEVVLSCGSHLDIIAS